MILWKNRILNFSALSHTFLSTGRMPNLELTEFSSSKVCETYLGESLLGATSDSAWCGQCWCPRFFFFSFFFSQQLSDPQSISDLAYLKHHASLSNFFVLSSTSLSYENLRKSIQVAMHTQNRYRLHLSCENCAKM